MAWSSEITVNSGKSADGLRIESILDLSRKLDLLNDLFRGARERASGNSVPGRNEQEIRAAAIVYHQWECVIPPGHKGE